MPQVERTFRTLVRPDKQRLLDEPIERCGHCMLLWPSDDMVETVQDNRPLRVCPNGDSPTTDVRFEAAFRESAVDEYARLIALPRVSLAPMEVTIPPTVTECRNTDGETVNAAHPLDITRSGTAVLVLVGVEFVAGDTLTLPTGTTINSSVLTSTRKTLTLLAASDAPRGTFSITFNSEATLKNVLRVR